MSEELTEVTEEETTELAEPNSVEDLEPKMKVKGKVDRLELYGAFVDIGVGANALIHISQLGKEHVNRVSDVLSVGDEIEVWVDKVDPERQQIMVSMIEPLAVEWSDLKTGQQYTGEVTRLESFGAFIDIGAEREGLVHISELSHDYVKQPSEVVKVGDEVQVQVLGFSKRKRRIDLSIKALEDKPEQSRSSSSSGYSRQSSAENYEEYEDDNEELPTAMEIALRRAMGDEEIDSLSPEDEKSRKKRRGKKKQSQQEDLLSRTLQLQKES